MSISNSVSQENDVAYVGQLERKRQKRRAGAANRFWENRMKLTANQVAVIKGLARLGIPSSVIAEMFKAVKAQQIRNIVNGKQWPNVEPANLFITDGKGVTISWRAEDVEGVE